MKIWSESFVDGQAMPARCALGVPDAVTHVKLSNNRNPHLAWSDVPSGTVSLALICHDPDVPSRGDDVNQEGRSVPAELPRVDFFHWLLIDLPADTEPIVEGEFSHVVTPHGKGGPVIARLDGTLLRHGLNDYTNWFAGDPDMGGDYYGYDGPCPPWNDSIAHRYVFTLYALAIARV
ncbi:MAG TPA: YbhB/YbcL family Raf kinase inhibitor-like protein, partial [Burkholderiaceae bacterium]|nr:YbhB/YbcL family Raf kinase inhibitor-like protein [Burkholderiaceae bacterium]